MGLDTSEKFTVRTTVAADQPSVTTLLKVSYPALMRSAYSPTVLSAVLPLITQANPTLLASDTFYLAETQYKDVIGCGGWTWERPGTRQIEVELGHIRHFATHPAWVGQSVGRSIYTVCEQATRAVGIKRLECYASLNAEGFYAALGFRSVRRLDVPLVLGYSIPSVLMERIL